MFEITPNGLNRLDITFSGKLDSEAMKSALDDFVSKSEGIVHGKMLYKVGDFELPTLGAIVIEMSYLPHIFKFIRQFDRAAVLADQGWLKKISEIEGALLPGVEIKGFDRDEEAQAEAWLNR